MEEPCQECGHLTLWVCEQCLKPTCDDHLKFEEDGHWCDDCLAKATAASLDAVGGRQLWAAERRYDSEAEEGPGWN